MGLFDAILIKENHIAAAGSIRKAISRAREQSPGLFIEVEVENLDELEQALDAGPNRILLDNFSVEDLKAACTLNSGCNQLEASGNITLDNIALVAESGVDFISTGSITKNIRAIDLSFQLLTH
jgi:nicotinate-nucleotide pyrophosphorylase (carboxylating)